MIMIIRFLNITGSYPEILYNKRVLTHLKEVLYIRLTLDYDNET